jgi:hypothetical protein
VIEPKNRELQAVRIEVAVNICVSFPELYPKLMSKNPVFIADKEYVAACVLKEMMRLEPCIKNILSFYYKREAR